VAVEEALLVTVVVNVVITHFSKCPVWYLFIASFSSAAALSHLTLSTLRNPFKVQPMSESNRAGCATRSMAMRSADVTAEQPRAGALRTFTSLELEQCKS
jgi:hypothetical protein